MRGREDTGKFILPVSKFANVRKTVTRQLENNYSQLARSGLLHMDAPFHKETRLRYQEEGPNKDSQRSSK